MNTVTLWHAGFNLDSHPRQITPGKGLWEYGPGLYAHTDYCVARKYQKGPRKLYQIQLKPGSDAAVLETSSDWALKWITKNLTGQPLALAKDMLAEATEHKDSVAMTTFINICINSGMKSASAKKALIQALCDAGIDYLTERALGSNSGFVVVIFNAKAIASVKEVDLKNWSSDWILDPAEHQILAERLLNGF